MSNINKCHYDVSPEGEDQEPNIIWGALTIGLTFGPAFLGLIFSPSWSKGFKNFGLHLPGVQMFTHLRLQKSIASNQKIAKECERDAIEAKEKGGFEDERQYTQAKNRLELDAKSTQSELNEFKVKEAFGESYPQTLLQLSIVLKKGINPSFLTISAILSSIGTLMLTISGLTVSLPFYINGKRQVQFKDLKLTFFMILPLMVFGVTPRLMSLVALLSCIKADNAWLGITIIGILSLAHLIGYWSVLLFYVRPKVLAKKGLGLDPKLRLVEPHVHRNISFYSETFFIICQYYQYCKAS